MSLTDRIRGVASVGGGGGTKVKLTIKGTAAGMGALNVLVNKECDVEWTWCEFFSKNFAVTKINVDPDKHMVTRIAGKDQVLMHQKIRDLIGKFQKIKSAYRVNVVKRTGLTKSARGRPPKGTKPLPAETKANKGPKSSNSRRNGIKEETSFSTARPRSVSSVSSSSTAPLPMSHANIRIQPNNNKKSKPGPKRHSSSTQKVLSPRTARVNDDEVVLPGPEQEFRGISRPRVNLDEDDDNASQFTTASQESQDDLVELGIANEDLKPKVVKRLMENISNAELLRIRYELQKIMESGRWSKFSSRAPRTANVLMELIRVSAER